MSKVIDEFDSETEFEDLLLNADQQASTDWEMSFVEDMRGRFEQYGMNTYISDKQLETLNRIAGEG